MNFGSFLNSEQSKAPYFVSLGRKRKKVVLSAEKDERKQGVEKTTLVGQETETSLRWSVAQMSLT